jgi:hypothetical protein
MSPNRVTLVSTRDVFLSQAAISIDFDNLKPAFLAVDKPDFSKLTPEQLQQMIADELAPLKTERFPGYKPGTKDLRGLE